MKDEERRTVLGAPGSSVRQGQPGAQREGTGSRPRPARSGKAPGCWERGRRQQPIPPRPSVCRVPFFQAEDVPRLDASPIPIDSVIISNLPFVYPSGAGAKLGKPKWAAEGKRWTLGLPPLCGAPRPGHPAVCATTRTLDQSEALEMRDTQGFGDPFLDSGKRNKKQNKTKIKAGKTGARKERKRKPAPIHLRLAPFRGLRGIRRKSESLVHVGMQVTAKLPAWGRGPGGWPGLARTPATQAGQHARSSPARTALKRSPQVASGTSNSTAS